MKVTHNFLFITFFFILFSTGVHTKNSLIDVVTLGASPDREIDSSHAFLSAWDAACGSTGRPTIQVPPGRYLINNSITFLGGKDCKNDGVNFVIKGTLVAPADFRTLMNSTSWISFKNVAGVTISGGVFDGQGAGLWKCKMSGKGGCPSGITNLSFMNTNNLVIKRITSLNSQLYHIVVLGSTNVEIQGVKISASTWSPNTDGIHVQFSSGVTIQSCTIGSGDDCISIGAGTIDMWMENLKCGPGHGISIGSLAKDLNEPGVQNITVKTTTFIGTQNGVRIKSWGRPSNGFVKDVMFQHITMVNVQNPIIIDQNYCPSLKDCPGQMSGVKIDGVTYKDIHGSSASKVAVKLDCSPLNHCTNVKLEDVKLTYKDQLPSSTCVNVGGSTSGLVQPQGCL